MPRSPSSRAQSVLEGNGIRIPTMEEPWTADEFGAALATLKDAGYETPIDIGAEDTGEWWPYAYSPFLQSFGGDLIDRSTMLTADGALNGPEAVAWGEWFAGLFADGYADNSGTVGNQEFVDDEVALSYTGVWNAVAALDAVGDDLLILPPPDLGNGPKIGGGSWQWGISSECNDADGAREYLEFSFQDEYITEFADKQVVIPATEAAAQASEYFGDDGALRPFVEFSQEYARAASRDARLRGDLGHVRDRCEGHHERRRRAGDARSRCVGHRREHRVERRVRLPVIRRAGGGLAPPPAHPQRDLP